ncbi:hypothetical protein L1887_25634 [Cichorium endivia]|nr:hypothetical protein L1887_25634 [Cichorium endivia]
MAESPSVERDNGNSVSVLIFEFGKQMAKPTLNLVSPFPWIFGIGRRLPRGISGCFIRGGKKEAEKVLQEEGDREIACGGSKGVGEAGGVAEGEWS